MNEIGVGDSVKLFGGGMVGLQYASIMESLGPQLNGVVNYNVWVPEKTMEFPGVRDFLARYQAKAKQANVDPLGFYLPPFDYAIGEMLAQAVTATRSLDHKVLAKYLREHEMKTIVGPDPLWADRRMGQSTHRLCAVPRHRGQGPGPVPRRRQAGDRRTGRVPDRRSAIPFNQVRN